MSIDANIKTWNNNKDTEGSHKTADPATNDGAHEAADDFNARKSLLQAQKKAEEDKEAAQGAISRFCEQSKLSEKDAAKRARELDDAQKALTVAQNNPGKNPDSAELDKPDEKPPESLLTDKKARLSNEALNSGPFSVVSGIKKMFGNLPIKLDPEVKAEFYEYVMCQSPQLLELIDELTEDKTRIKTEKILNEARAEILAARAAVNRTQKENNEIKEKARKAITEADATRKTAEQLVAQVRQSTIGQVVEEIGKAREEVKAVKAAAETAARKAEEELARVKAEAAAAGNKAAVTITLAQEKIKKDAEEFKNYKLQAKIAVKQAIDEASRLKEEAEAARREAQEAISKAALESQQANKEIELASKKVQECTTIAEKQAFDKFCEEIAVIRKETESTSQMACEAINKAREEAQQARKELAICKQTHEAALLTARQDAAIARTEAKNTVQKAQESLFQAQEEARKAKAEADVAAQKASETMFKAREDLTRLTRDEISLARQKLEAADKGETVPESDKVSKDENEQAVILDSQRISTLLHEIRAPLHSISGFARLMLEEDAADPAARKELLTFMAEQGESLNRQIDDLTSFLHKGSGRSPIEKESAPAAPNQPRTINGF